MTDESGGLPAAGGEGVCAVCGREPVGPFPTETEADAGKCWATCSPAAAAECYRLGYAIQQERAERLSRMAALWKNGCAFFAGLNRERERIDVARALAPHDPRGAPPAGLLIKEEE